MAEEVIQSNGYNNIQASSVVGGSIHPSLPTQLPLIPPKKKRNLPGNPDPEAEVISLSPKTLMATNRFLCEICGKGFQRDQNLQLHRRGHNLPWKLKQRSCNDLPPKKRVYVCPDKTCVHHHPSRALGDLTGIKKHFCRKHGDKKWKCEKCNKRYAVHSDWKAHSKTCGTREYKCDCGTVFSRRDSFITHRAFCDALAEETARLNAAAAANSHFNINASMAIPSTAPNNNYHFQLQGGSGGVTNPQQFSTIFNRPPSNIVGETTTTADLKDQDCSSAQRGGGGALPLWMAQVLSQSAGHHHNNNYQHDMSTLATNNNIDHQDLVQRQQLGSSMEQNLLYPNSSHPLLLIPNSNHQLLRIPSTVPSSSSTSSSDYNNHLNWGVFGSCKFSSEACQPAATNSLPLISSAIGINIRDHVVSIPSSTLYTSQHQQVPPSSAAPVMSATALLQKAAQIEALTSSTHGAVDDPLFLASGYDQKQQQQQLGGKRKYCTNEVGEAEAAAGSTYKYSSTGQIIYGSINNSTTTNIASDVESSVSNINCYNNQLMYPGVPNKRHKLLHISNGTHDQESSNAAGEGGKTRDFLGVGVQSICHPSSINGWI